jgi:hypothetical protein
MSTLEEPKQTGLDPRLKRAAIYAGILIVVFLLGLVPMWLRGRSTAAQLDAAQRQLRLCQLESTLATAALNARRGEYEPARKAASEFFTTLSKQIDLGKASDFSDKPREGLKQVLNERDNVITLLARSDPASADRLLDIFLSYQKTVSGS